MTQTPRAEKAISSRRRRRQGSRRSNFTLRDEDEVEKRTRYSNFNLSVVRRKRFDCVWFLLYLHLDDNICQLVETVADCSALPSLIGDGSFTVRSVSGHLSQTCSRLLTPVVIAVVTNRFSSFETQFDTTYIEPC
jgi:hypothetical protein